MDICSIIYNNFLETGLVVTPFLPGDSIIFASGALAAIGGVNPDNEFTYHILYSSCIR